jgi:ribonuclease HI
MIELWTDGASTGRRDREGGWGWVLVKDDKYQTHGYGGHPKTTNNVQEVTAAIQGMWYCYDHDIKGITLVSDSMYVLNSATGLWKAQKNLELIAELQLLAQYLKIETRWCKGHSGVRWNELADRLATRGKRKAKLGLFNSDVL